MAGIDALTKTRFTDTAGGLKLSSACRKTLHKNDTKMMAEFVEKKRRMSNNAKHPRGGR
jgi:hypothetical protein